MDKCEQHEKKSQILGVTNSHFWDGLWLFAFQETALVLLDYIIVDTSEPTLPLLDPPLVSAQYMIAAYSLKIIFIIRIFHIFFKMN